MADALIRGWFPINMSKKGGVTGFSGLANKNIKCPVPFKFWISN